MSDNLLTSVIRAWDTDATIDMKQKLILVAPAMNSVQFPLPILLLTILRRALTQCAANQAMWRNPMTAKQIRVLTDDWGVKDEPSADGASAGWFKVLTVGIPPFRSRWNSALTCL